VRNCLLLYFGSDRLLWIVLLLLLAVFSAHFVEELSELFFSVGSSLISYELLFLSLLTREHGINPLHDSLRPLNRGCANSWKSLSVIVAPILTTPISLRDRLKLVLYSTRFSQAVALFPMGIYWCRSNARTEMDMQKRTIIPLGFILLGSCLVLSGADEKRPTFFFGGQQVYVGMSKQEAVASLSHCCKISPPVESGVERQPAPENTMLGHFILSKEESPQRILGAVYFSGGKILRITRPLDEEIDTFNDGVVAFARAIKRSLPAEGDGGTTVRVSVRHERITNAESDVVSFSFPNGRGIELHIGTLDKPDTQTNKRDFATLDETLEP